MNWLWFQQSSQISTRIVNQTDIGLQDTWKINMHILDLDSKKATFDSNAATFVRSSWISLWRTLSLTSNLSSNDATQSKHDVNVNTFKNNFIFIWTSFSLANQFWDNVKSKVTLDPKNSSILPLIKSYQSSRGTAI